MSSFQVHELPADKLKNRDVVPIDIANDPIATNDYKATEDPQKYVQTYHSVSHFLIFDSFSQIQIGKNESWPIGWGMEGKCTACDDLLQIGYMWIQMVWFTISSGRFYSKNWTKAFYNIPSVCVLLSMTFNLFAILIEHVSFIAVNYSVGWINGMD